MENKQLIEISQTIRDHLIKQQKQALNEQGNCMYRGCGGAMCAVGVLIKDEFYNPDIENKCIDDDSVIRVVSKSLGVDELPWEVCELLDGWQGYHDIEYKNFLNGDQMAASPTTKHIELTAHLSQ